MILPLTLSSIAAGSIATAVMVVFLYLPLLWGGTYYDTLGALGTLFTRGQQERDRVLGGLALLAGGILFAAFYGWAVLMFTVGGLTVPDYMTVEGLPLPVNLFFPLLGLVMGLCQGIFISMMTVFAVTDVHPVESYREPFSLVTSYVIGHMVYGVVVMFFQSQFLPLLIN